MATTNVFLIMSESMFEQVETDPDKKPDNPDATPNWNYGTGVAARPGAIEVLDFSFGVEQVGSEPSGRPRSVEAVNRSAFEFKKTVDARSPKLFRFCCEGTFIRQAECQIYGPTNVPYLIYHMRHVHVASYSAKGGSELGTETIKLTYGEMAVKFNNAGIGTENQGNSKTGTVQTKWSWVLEVPGLDPLALIGGMRGSQY